MSEKTLLLTDESFNFSATSTSITGRFVAQLIAMEHDKVGF